MVTQQKEVSYRLRFWELYITHNLTPRDNCHEWSPTIPRRVTCQPKDGPPLTQGWLPHFAMLGPSWLRLTPFSRGCPCCLIWSSLAPFWANNRTAFEDIYEIWLHQRNLETSELSRNFMEPIKVHSSWIYTIFRLHLSSQHFSR